MYKKITGVDTTDLEEVRANARQARRDFQAAVNLCNDKRQEYLQMK